MQLRFQGSLLNIRNNGRTESRWKVKKVGTEPQFPTISLLVVFTINDLK